MFLYKVTLSKSAKNNSKGMANLRVKIACISKFSSNTAEKKNGKNFLFLR